MLHTAVLLPNPSRSAGESSAAVGAVIMLALIALAVGAWASFEWQKRQ